MGASGNGQVIGEEYKREIERERERERERRDNSLHFKSLIFLIQNLFILE